jgi:hypothetical protein
MWIHSGGSVTRIATSQVDSVTFVFADTTRPQSPLVTATTVGTESIRLDWTAVADPREDGSFGAAAHYELRRSYTANTPFASMTPVAMPMTPATPGTPESFTVTGLAPGINVYFVLAVTDGHGNTSYSNQASTNTLAMGPRDVVIAELYVGGGATGAAYTHDYVVLFNTTDAVVSLSGRSLQRASTSGSSWQSLPLTGSIGPHGYFLVQLGSQGTNGSPLPTPDMTGAISLTAKLVIKTSTATESGICPGPQGTWYDLVGWGSANCSEAAPAPGGWGVTTALVRLAGGCVDTDNNSTNFTVGTPSPRNSSSPTLTCP